MNSHEIGVPALFAAAVAALDTEGIHPGIDYYSPAVYYYYHCEYYHYRCYYHYHCRTVAARVAGRSAAHYLVHRFSAGRARLGWRAYRSLRTVPWNYSVHYPRVVAVVRLDCYCYLAIHLAAADYCSDYAGAAAGYGYMWGKYFHGPARP